MNNWTPYLAAIVVLVHCAVIFWPRKPLDEVDENGLPVLWRNEQETRKNVACIWKDASEQLATPPHEEAHSRRRSA